MRRPEIIEGHPFDWEDGKKHAENVVDEHGDVNWRSAFFADPGCTSCPTCHAYYWAEGIRQRCLDCRFEYPTDWWPRVAQGRDHRVLHDGCPKGNGAAEWKQRMREQYRYPKIPDCPYYMWGWNHGDIAADFVKTNEQDWRSIIATWNAGKQIVDALGDEQQ